jgi:hypothetical protein
MQQIRSYEYLKFENVIVRTKSSECMFLHIMDTDSYLYIDLERSCNYHNFGHYPFSCLLFKTRRFGDCILSTSSGGTNSVGPSS